MDPLRIQVFGTVRVQCGDRTQAITSPAQAQLLGYLALHATEGRVVPRAQLADTLYPQLASDEARRALSGVLVRLRRALGSLAAHIVCTTQIVQLSSAEVDIDRFTAMALQEQPAAWCAAIDLYEGEFLADLDAPWIQGRRALYHELFLSLMARAIDALRTVRRDTEALLYTQRWLQADPFNEEAHRTFMELYQQLGRPMAALEHFTHLQALLHDELQMMPLPATQQLAARIRHAQHEQARSSDNAHYDAQNRVTSTARDGSAAPRNALAANEGTPNKPLPTLTPALHAALEMAVALGRHFTPTMWSAVYGAESTLRLLRDSGLLTQHNDMYCLADSELYQAIRRATPEQRQFVLLDQVGTALYRALHAPPPPTLVHLARADAPLGRSLAEHERVAVTWTINAGSADSLVLTQHGKQALRRHRLLRLLHEALTQNALPSDHDLALALGVSERTIEHDIVALSQAGHTITTRRRRAKAGNEDTFRDSDPAPIGSYRDTMHSISE